MYKLPLDENEKIALISLLDYAIKNHTKHKGYKYWMSSLGKLLDLKPEAISPKKQESIKKATAARSNAARVKVLGAIQDLKNEDVSITAYSIAKRAGVSYQTAKKYYDTIQNESKNKSM